MYSSTTPRPEQEISQQGGRDRNRLNTAKRKIYEYDDQLERRA